MLERLYPFQKQISITNLFPDNSLSPTTSGNFYSLLDHHPHFFIPYADLNVYLHMHQGWTTRVVTNLFDTTTLHM